MADFGSLYTRVVQDRCVADFGSLYTRVVQDRCVADCRESLYEGSTGSLCDRITVCVQHLSSCTGYSQQSFAVSLGIDD